MECDDSKWCTEESECTSVLDEVSDGAATDETDDVAVKHGIFWCMASSDEDEEGNPMFAAVYGDDGALVNVTVVVCVVVIALLVVVDAVVVVKVVKKVGDENVIVLVS